MRIETQRATEEYVFKELYFMRVSTLLSVALLFIVALSTPAVSTDALCSKVYSHRDTTAATAWQEDVRDDL